MSNKDLTELVLVIDRSGSMAKIQKDAEGGVNSMLEEQRALDGDCNVTIVEFDNQYEFVCKGTPIADVAPYRLVPRGMTALLDAVGRAVSETKVRIKAIDKKDRPGLVAFVIVTDGQENSSMEYTNEAVQKLIKKRRKKGWSFTFLGADEKAFAQAQAIGIDLGNAGRYDKGKVAAAYSNASRGITRSRTSRSAGASLEASVAASALTDDERKLMVDDPNSSSPS